MSMFSDFIEETSDYIHTTSQGLLRLDFGQDLTNALTRIGETIEEKMTLVQTKMGHFLEDVEIAIERLECPTPSSSFSRWVQSVEDRSEDIFRKVSRRF